MRDLDNGYDQPVIDDLIDYPIDALTNPVAFLAGKFFAASPSWFVCECIDP